MNPTIPQTPAPAETARAPHEISEAARQANCGYCWQRPGRPCTGTGVPGDHLARWLRAERKGLVSRAELDAVIARLDVIEARALIYDTPGGAL